MKTLQTVTAYQVVFSTYHNATKKYIAEGDALLQRLAAIAEANGVEGFSLRDQSGYYAKETEKSHILELIGATEAQAIAVSNAIKEAFSQMEVILKAEKQQLAFI